MVVLDPSASSTLIMIIIMIKVIRYDTIESLTWTRKLSIQLYLAHVARQKN